MEHMLEETASVIALAAAGIFFMTGLLTGAWKYFAMMASPEVRAPHYVDIAHRASLMYSFAAILLAVFAALSPWPSVVNVAATIAPLAFFGIAILFYIKLGLENRTDSHLRDSDNKGADKGLMWALMICEIGGFAVLLAGFFWRILG